VKCAIDTGQKQSVDSIVKNMVTRMHAEKTRITRCNNNRGLNETASR
jgi:hypothetical protein